LLAEAANVRALHDQSVAAGQLPDPQLLTGITQLPVNGGEALSLRDDDFTALSVGISQEFPRAAKRELRAAVLEQQATGAQLALTDLEQRVRLEAGRAYIEVVAAVHGAQILEQLSAEALRQRDVAGIDLVAGRGAQPELLAAQVEAALVTDRGRALRQREQAGRAKGVALTAWPAAHITMSGLASPQQVGGSGTSLGCSALQSMCMAGAGLAKCLATCAARVSCGLTAAIVWTERTRVRISSRQERNHAI